MVGLCNLGVKDGGRDAQAIWDK